VRDAVKLGRVVGREEVHDLTKIFREAADNAGATRERGQGTRAGAPSSPPPAAATPLP